MKYQKSIILLAVIILGLTALLLSTNPDSVESQQSSPIKIGVTIPLTGKFSHYGEAELHGLKMAVKDVNREGGINGRKLKLVVEDNQGKAKKAVRNVQRLTSVENADIIWTAFTHISQAVKGAVREQGKLFFYASTYKGIAEGGKYSFRDYYDASRSGRTIAKVVDSKGHKQVAFIKEEGDACRRFEKAFEEKAESLGIEIIGRTKHKPSTKDLRSELTKLPVEKADALVTCTWRTDKYLMEQMKELRLLDTPTYHWAALVIRAANTPEMREIYEENNAITTWYGLPGQPSTEKQREFVERYRNKHGKKPRGDALYAYDDVHIIADALRACNADPSNKDCIRKEILQTDYEGVGGHISFDRNGSARREVFLIQVKNGTWREINPLEG